MQRLQSGEGLRFYPVQVYAHPGEWVWVEASYVAPVSESEWDTPSEQAE